MSDDGYKQAYLRERQARDELEEILEDKSRELFKINESLKDKILTLEKQKHVVMNADKMATLGSLSGGIAHEINNPLAYINSNVEVLTDYSQDLFNLISTISTCVDSETENSPQEKLESIQSIISNFDLPFIKEDTNALLSEVGQGCKKIKTIVASLQEFSGKKASFDHGCVLSTLINSCTCLIHNKLKSFDLAQNIEFNDPIDTDEHALRQVLLNLLINAVEACEENGKTNKEIQINTYSDAQNLYIEIKDNGIGMSEAILTRAFDPFYSTKPIGHATGMGLPISFSIIDQLGGNLTLTSEVQIGSCALITLPLSE